MGQQRSPSSHSAPSEFYYRRGLTTRELLPAIGAAIGVGLAAFYVARLLIQRTPLEPAPPRMPRRRPAVSPR